MSHESAIEMLIVKFLIFITTYLLGLLVHFGSKAEIQSSSQSADDHVIRLKVPERLLNGPFGEIYV